MLRNVLRGGARLALVVGFVAPPFLAYTWATCPNTRNHQQLCPNTPDAKTCPVTGGTQGCESFEWVTVRSDWFGCKTKNASSLQCIDGTENAPCYTQGQCKSKTGTNDCEVDATSGQTILRILKITESCI